MTNEPFGKKLTELDMLIAPFGIGGFHYSFQENLANCFNFQKLC
jgi:hypothetical protein